MSVFSRCLSYLDAVRHWKRSQAGYSPILRAQQLARETKTEDEVK